MLKFYLKRSFRLLILFSFALTLSSCSTTPPHSSSESKKKSEKNWDQDYHSVIAQGMQNDFEPIKALGTGPARYQVRVHAPSLYPYLQFEYQASQIKNIEDALKTTLHFSLDSRGLARAADRVEDSANDETHYDAVWVRDSMWVYLGLKESLSDESVETQTENKAKAKQLLLTLANYFGSPDQIARMNTFIQNPSLIQQGDQRMNVPHIRFDRNSVNFQDVQDNGHAQTWNHKQNDALGLFLELFCKAILNHEIKSEDLSKAQIEVLKILPRYFSAIRFYQMEDAGSWEEIDRVNTSSIALVTSGLEKLNLLLKEKNPLTAGISSKMIRTLIQAGYRVIHRQLALGGESPAYSRSDSHFRTSDAALLNLIYPAELSRLKEKDYQKILKALDPLIGDVGIRRYLGDSYQSGNFWFHDWLGASSQKAKTDDASSSESFANRAKQYIKGSEAQWFFDSWYSIGMNTLAKKYKKSIYRRLSTQFLNRALAQVTGGSTSHPVLGADGNPVAPLALPESYNTVVDLKTNKSVFAPSPITPLNWSKACMRIALKRSE